MIRKKRKLRNKGLEEIIDINMDIIWYLNQSKKEKFISRRYFNKIYRAAFNNLDMETWLIYEKHLQAYNCAYEEMLDFKKHNGSIWNYYLRMRKQLEKYGTV